MGKLEMGFFFSESKYQHQRIKEAQEQHLVVSLRTHTSELQSELQKRGFSVEDANYLFCLVQQTYSTMRLLKLDKFEFDNRGTKLVIKDSLLTLTIPHNGKV